MLARLRRSAAVAIALASALSLHHPVDARDDDCSNICGPSASCDTACLDYVWTTCGAYGGAPNYCEGYCGDSICNYGGLGETGSNCSADCPCFDRASFGVVTTIYESAHSTAAVALGVGSVRIDAKWDEVEGTEGTRDWSVIDDRFNRARMDGMEVLVSLGGDHNPSYGYPSWALNPQVYSTWEDGWYAYVYDAVSRYAASGVALGIWNEPDLTGANDPTFDWDGNPSGYAYLVAIADSARDTANSGAVLAVPETSVFGRNVGSSANGFFDDAMSWINYYGALNSQDVITVHYYANGDLSLYDYVSAVAYTTGSRPIWVTELGGYTDHSYMGAYIPTFLTSGLPWYKVFPYVLQNGSNGGFALCDSGWDCNTSGHNAYAWFIDNNVCS